MPRTIALFSRMPPWGATLLEMCAVVRALHQEWRQHQHLAELDERLLKDVGLTRVQVSSVAREAAGSPR